MTAKPAKATPSTLQSENLQGHEVSANDPDALREAIELAFNYRGDVMIIRKSDPQPVEGYVFDRHAAEPRRELVVRLIPRDSDQRIAIAMSDIASLKFTGKDTASGKTFENWIRKYAQKTLAGETASIESESLDED